MFVYAKLALNVSSAALSCRLSILGERHARADACEFPKRTSQRYDFLISLFLDFTMCSYCEKPDNETAEMGGVPHVEGGLNSELYAVPVKRRQPKDQKNNAILQNNTQEKPSDVDGTDSEDKDENLPPGWQKHEGGYLSGTRDRSDRGNGATAPYLATNAVARSSTRDNVERDSSDLLD